MMDFNASNGGKETGTDPVVPSAASEVSFLDEVQILRGNLTEIPELLLLMEPRWLDRTQKLDSQLGNLVESLKVEDNEDAASLSVEAQSDVLAAINIELEAEGELTRHQIDSMQHREKMTGRHESAWLRARVDDCLRITSEDVTSIVKSHDASVRDTLLPQGEFLEMARVLSEGVDLDNLAIEDFEENSLIEFRESKALEIQQRLIKQLIVFLENEAEKVNQETERVVSKVGKAVSSLLGWNVKLEFPRFDIGRVQDFAATSTLAPISIRSEIPRVSRGVFIWRAFLQPAMMAGMILMPFWILTMDLRSKDIIDRSVNRSGLLLIIFAVLYPGYFFFQLQKVPKDRKNQIAKELAKMKQTVKVELEKSFRAVLDEHKRMIGDHWRKVIDDLRKQLMECVNLAGEERQQSEFYEERLRLIERVQKGVVELEEDPITAGR